MGKDCTRQSDETGGRGVTARICPEGGLSFGPQRTRVGYKCL